MDRSLSRTLRRREILLAGLALPVVAPLATRQAPAVAVAPRGGTGTVGAPAAAPAAAAPAGSVILDPHGDKEPSGTEVRAVDGTNVVFSYGAVMPSFDGWSRHESTRGYISLDGAWRFRYDPDNRGLDAGWNLPGVDDSSWDTIAVPSAWDLHGNDGWGGYDAADFGKGGSLVDGYAWYRTTVHVPASWKGRYVRLAFLAASYSADVWVDGQFVGKHEGGHTAFALPLGSALRPGHDAVLAVRVYRRASYTTYDGIGEKVSDDKALPPGVVDDWPYAGLTRSAWLEAVPQVTVAKLLLDASTSTLDARVVVENHGDVDFHGQVRVDPGKGAEAAPKTVAVSVPAGGVAVSAVRIPIPHAPRWSPDHPTVLEARASLLAGTHAVDTLASTYGARGVDVGGAQLRLDGTAIFLKGYNWHEETAESGRAMTIKEYDHELGQAKVLGANYLRNCVYNRHPYVYDWADRHGVTVLDEWDTMWVNTAQQQLQTQQYGLCRALALATAWNNHNHPSVIMWGLQNESTVDANGAPVYRAWLAQMKDAVKSVDLAGRPVTWASNTSWDPAFDLADVVGFNEYFGYFYGKNEDLGPTLDAVHATYPDKPILLTENGSWSFLGNHGAATEAGTEEWQAANFRSHWDQVSERPFLAGYTFWLLKDYKERAGYNQEYNGLSTMGMLGWDGRTTRKVFDDFKAAPPPQR
ncbi:MAG TPA: glycoside hydrolase family 2 TIM barrel-domain containing protein [Actinopolymorphaceae bacterium]|nr:glycoside hydrolase family 2 TIM barrel-domain containing protein [Actinopolymorphaceae bacterium]